MEEAYRIAPNFQGEKFQRICNFQNFTGTISADAVNFTPNGLLFEHFHTQNFRGWRSIFKTAKILRLENWPYMVCFCQYCQNRWTHVHHEIPLKHTLVGSLWFTAFFTACGYTNIMNTLYTVLMGT